MSTHVAPLSQTAPTAVRRDRRWPRAAVGIAFGLALALGIWLRLWQLGTSPAWQWDEAVYWRVGVSVQHGVLAEHSVFGSPWEPFLYQPPAYFLLLARWFSAVGASIYHARLLGVLFTALMLPLLFWLLWKLHGPRTALLTLIPVVFDGWLMYIERASYIENVLAVLVVAALLLYQRALERPTLLRFALAGAGIGVAGAFKQTGIYVLVAVLLCWLIVRRDHRGHLLMLGVALGILAGYLGAMVRMYDLPGHDWFIQQNLHQVLRVLGADQSGGTLTSPVAGLHLLATQYKYFIISALAGLAALLIALRRLVQCYRERNWAPARDNALLFSWFGAGVVVFGSSSLKFPQYFALILIPGYCYLWTELQRWDWRSWLRYATPAAAGLAGIASLLLVLPAFRADPLQQVQHYAATRIPRGAIVVTEESIGDLIDQRWCTVEKSASCSGVASYAITWNTYLQSSFKQGDPAFHRMMIGARRITSFTGSTGTATVWLLRGKQ
jgi:4-amino-4-deoxy-L-arabinose transferase-like glycosyltransferase